MNTLQIQSLRDFAIDHLPRAQADREQLSRMGGSEADYYRRLAFTSTMVQGKPGTSAVEIAAARVLSTVAILCGERDKPLTGQERAEQIERLTSEANELCSLTSREIAWLASVATTPAPTEEEKVTAAPAQDPTDSIAGKLLTTDQTAEILQVQPATVRAWAREERGPIRPVREKFGREYRYSGDEILALLKSGETPKPRGRKKTHTNN